MPDDDLGPMPEPMTEDPELVPGGVDAIMEPVDDNLGRDLNPDDNPAVDDVLPEEIAEPDDKSQAPDEGSDADAASTAESDSDDTSGEPDAGQEAEDGSVEPPA